MQSYTYQYANFRLYMQHMCINNCTYVEVYMHTEVRMYIHTRTYRDGQTSMQTAAVGHIQDWLSPLPLDSQAPVAHHLLQQRAGPGNISGELSPQPRGYRDSREPGANLSLSLSLSTCIHIHIHTYTCVYAHIHWTSKPHLQTNVGSSRTFPGTTQQHTHNDQDHERYNSTTACLSYSRC